MFKMEIKIPLLLLLIVFAQSEQVALSIISVSNEASSVVQPVYSGLRGGKMVYIKAQGHSPDPSDNLIFVGTFPCTVPADGVTDTFITCVTTDTGSSSNINNMPVTLISYGTSVTTSYPNTVYFQTGHTP